MKKVFFIIIIVFFYSQTFAYKLIYAEQFYKLYHLNLYHYPENILENIFYLEMSLKADFCNPLYALAKIEDKNDWERYKNLFRMHVNLKLVEMHIKLATKYDRQKAYFYNAPFKEDNLKSLEKAEKAYNMAFYYWDEAKKWSDMVTELGKHLDQIQNWEDESFRIKNKSLDYNRIINMQLGRIAELKKTFQEMDSSTY